MIKGPYIFYWCGNAIKIFLFALVSLLLTTCKKQGSRNSMFEVLGDDRTGLHFVNGLRATQEFNMFDYMYFYNGAGIGAGDFNKDGLIDLFFASNQGENKLFLNMGKLKFTDVTKEAQIPEDSA